MPTFCRCFINLHKVHDSEDYKLATVGRSIIRQRAAPNCIALAALVYKLWILEEGHPVCDFEVTLCNIGLRQCKRSEDTIKADRLSGYLLQHNVVDFYKLL